MIAIIDYPSGEGFKHQEDQDLVFTDALWGPPEDLVSRSVFISGSLELIAVPDTHYTQV